MYPMAPGVCLIVAVTPSFLGAATILSLSGHFTVVPKCGPLSHSSIDSAQVLREHVIGTTAVRPADNRDVQVGKFDIRVVFSNQGIIPLLYLCQKYIGVSFSAQFKIFWTSRVDCTRGRWFPRSSAAVAHPLLLEPSPHRSWQRRWRRSPPCG